MEYKCSECSCLRQCLCRYSLRRGLAVLMNSQVQRRRIADLQRNLYVPGIVVTLPVRLHGLTGGVRDDGLHACCSTGRDLQMLVFARDYWIISSYMPALTRGVLQRECGPCEPIEPPHAVDGAGELVAIAGFFSILLLLVHVWRSRGFGGRRSILVELTALVWRSDDQATMISICNQRNVLGWLRSIE